MALDFLYRKKNKKVGIMGASTTGMMDLLAASYFPDFTLTLVISPGDFVINVRKVFRKWMK